MKTVFYKIIGVLWPLTLVGSLVLFTYHSATKQFEVPSREEITALNNVDESSRLKRATLISRQSAVKVVSLAPDNLKVSAGSGTYVTVDNRYFILTMAHGVNPDCEFVRIVVEGETEDPYKSCKKIIEINVFTDYAIIEVDKINTLSPVSIMRSVPRNTEWIKSFAPLTSLVYTGHPNNIGALTIEGQVMGYSEDDHIFMHSYGWSGASGSGVFNEDGQLVGYVMAILMGESEHGINVLEDVVVVVPLFKVDWSVVFHR